MNGFVPVHEGSSVENSNGGFLNNMKVDMFFKLDFIFWLKGYLTFDEADVVLDFLSFSCFEFVADEASSCFPKFIYLGKLIPCIDDSLQ